ncbi:F-box incomplete domain containing protein [Pandoravirus neocaledonia]|uniref:F-box incomplete domain containing protein n=1 Tax=Pandoravirus neocaledonia TaxID=2107708 RepID=A0A2U7UCY5_9VIRU|nr:F-box incomplete domain containing protein [Pandoravirus neocaledonia]AVK76321.1 F-box incomplete domain containing protein [Pandoravirus neocaledonia]
MDANPMLPAELMCVVFGHLPLPWWVAAARVCRWWRACIQTAWALRRGSLAKGACPSLQHTLCVAVRGGHADAALWIAEIVGADSTSTASVAMWMASHPNRSWKRTLTDAARAGREDIIMWVARHAVPTKESFAAEVAAAYGLTGCVEKLVCAMRAEWSHRVIACALVSGNTECIDVILADRRVPVRLPLAYIAAITLPQYVDTLLGCERLPCRLDDVDAVRWLAAQNLPLDGSTRADVIRPRIRPSTASPLDAKALTWPPMRRLHPDDLFSRGALADYCQLNYWSTSSVRKYICDLLDPLLVGDAPRDERRRAIKAVLPWPPTKSLSRRVSPYHMGMRASFTALRQQAILPYMLARHSGVSPVTLAQSATLAPSCE